MVDGDDDTLDLEDYHPHVVLGVEEVHDQLALGVEEVHDHLALVELEVQEELVELVEDLEEELDDACKLEILVLEFLREVLPLIAPIAVAFGNGST